MEVTTKLGLAKGKSKPAVTYLGTDFACGRRRGQARAAGKRKMRLRKSSQRLAKAAKLKSLRKADGRLGRVYTTGIKMAAHYGVEVNGVDDQELLAIRRQA
eukprot:8481909-Pyramimonas_sp.AAC.1